MSDERKERCETCRFWNADGPASEHPGYADLRECRRHAPVPVQLGNIALSIRLESSTGSECGWPTTAPDDWCGEWEPKESS